MGPVDRTLKGELCMTLKRVDRVPIPESVYHIGATVGCGRLEQVKTKGL